MAINLIEQMPEDKLAGVIDYLSYLLSKPAPLDAYDYELFDIAESSDRQAEGIVTIKEAFEAAGVDYGAI